MLALIGPFVTRIELLHSENGLVKMWMIYAAIVLLIDIIFFYFLWMRPHLETGRGYYLVGKFDVLEKESFMGFKYLSLIPGIAHKIKVDEKFFRTLIEGEKILLEINYLGETRKSKGSLVCVREYKTVIIR